MKTWIREILLSAVVWLALYKLAPLPASAGVILHLVHHAAVIVTSLSIPALWLMYRNRDLVRMLLEVVADENTRRLPPVRDFVGVSLLYLRERISELYRSPGLRLENSADLRELARACFRRARSSYRGVDTHVPSEWMRRYRVFLEAQEQTIRPGSLASERILAVSRDALRDDLRDHAEIFREFVKWHRDYNVLLLQIDPADAKRFSEDVQVNAIDIAFWVDHYAVIFRPADGGVADEKVVVQMLLNGDSRYRDANRYIVYVTGKATSIEYEEGTGALVFRERQRSENDFLYEARWV